MAAQFGSNHVPRGGQVPGVPAANVVMLETTNEMIARLRPSRVFKDAVGSSKAGEAAMDGQSGAGRPTVKQITSIAFDDRGEKCLTAGQDDAFVLYDAVKARKLKMFYSKKYGIDHARFTHTDKNIVHASTKVDHAIRYHSLHNNEYISYFKGHTGTVRSLHMNPADDTFLSAGDDGTVRLWDLRAPTCRGLLNDVGGSTIAAFDNTGKVFAVACSNTQTIMLYDSTNLDNAPFKYSPFFDPELLRISSPPPRPIFTSVSFSNNGEFLLLSTTTHGHYLLDGYDLQIVRKLSGQTPLNTDPAFNNPLLPPSGPGVCGEEVCFTADSQWVVSGSGDGSLCFWKTPVVGDSGGVKNESPIVVRPSEEGIHSASRTVAFNPRYFMVAVGGDNLSFWLPERTDAIKEGY